MANMRAVVIRQAGGPEVLRIETVPIPVPKDGEVLVRVKAFGLNRIMALNRLRMMSVGWALLADKADIAQTSLKHWV